MDSRSFDYDKLSLCLLSLYFVLGDLDPTRVRMYTYLQLFFLTMLLLSILNSNTAEPVKVEIYTTPLLYRIEDCEESCKDCPESCKDCPEDSK